MPRIAALHPAGVAVSQRLVVPDSSGGGSVSPPVAHISSELRGVDSDQHFPLLVQKSEETADFSSATGEEKTREIRKENRDIESW